LNIKQQQLNLVLENNFSSFVGNIVVAIILAFTLGVIIETSSIYIWLAFLLSTSVYRTWLSHSIQKRSLTDENTQRYINQFHIAIALNALGWAALVVLFMDEASPLVNAFILVTIAGIASGSLSTLIAIKKYYYSFVFILVSPVFVMFLMMQGFEHKMFAIVVLFFILFMFKNGAIFHTKMTDNLILIESNQTLISDLQVQKDKALEVSELKSQFLANMSHEIRTPLNAITGFIRILKQDETDATKLDYLQTVNESSNDLMSIIDDILDFSKLEQNQISIERIKLNPIVEINQSIELFKKNAEKKNLTIEVDYIDSIPEYITSDPLRIKQILNNLLSNAIKFSSKNSLVKVKVSYLEVNSLLEISVIDNGIGIPNDRLNSIFDSFTQADNSSTRKYGGTGLGLSVSSRLVHLLGGTIHVESTLGVGSRFRFTVQAPSVVEKNPLNTQVNQTLLSLKESEKKVLIAEDNSVNQKLLAAILGKLDISFDIVENGLEAVEAFKNKRYKLILMDENMPLMTGSEATQEIREMEKTDNLGHIPIIAVTANAFESDRQRFLAAGMDEFIPKPVNFQKLEDLMNHYLTLP